ncbi:MAG: class I SAM-dependent methyltransferase [Nitrospirae bacterium]|nr:class I SAM-dependent methyltransferase [Nitrospirota bacterium]
MKDHYSEDYFKPYLQTEALHARKRFRKRIKEIKRLRFPGSLLDIGCGAGFFLKLAADEGYNVSGVELSQWACEYARKTFALNVINGELKDAGFAPDTFDVITLWHIVEHVSDPVKFLMEVNRLLKKDGLLVVEVPNIRSVAAKLAGTNWELMAPKEHFFYFDLHTMSRLLQMTGFAVSGNRSYFWTTPGMVLRAKAGPKTGLSRLCLLFFALLIEVFSFLRFQPMPAFIQGDVITVYAFKTENVSGNTDEF